jgi:protein TonB
VPTPQARPRPPEPKPAQAPPDAASRTPSTGEEPREGSTRTETGARGQGFGLSTGGGGLGGVRVDADFCCPEYIEDMARRIKLNWQDKHGLVGSTMIQFTIAKDGTIQGVRVERSSGFFVLDEASTRALQRTARLPPLPPAYPHPTLDVGLRFDYQR